MFFIEMRTFINLCLTTRINSFVPISIPKKVFKMILFKINFILFFQNFVASSELLNTRRIDPDMQNRLNAFVENVYLPFIGVSGLGLSVVQNDGELLYTTGYGYADHSRKIAIGNRTQFLLASVTKSITAVIVAKTLHEHFPHLDEAVLDTPIKELMPQANFILSDRLRSEQATFRDLLSHRLCISRDDFPLYTEAYNSTSELLYRQRYAQPSCGFRTKFEYNNQMVLMASHLIGQLLDKDFVEYTENFLNQLGMFDSAFIRETDDFSTMKNRALPYYIIDKKSYLTNPDLIKRVVHMKPIGGLFVSPNDMARFLIFQLNRGQLEGKQLVPEKVMSWLTKPSVGLPHMKFRNSDQNNIVDTNVAYGLCLIVGMYDGWEKNSHGGAYAPYHSEMSWYPALNIGIFSSTHQTPSLPTNSALHAFIFEAVRGNARAEQVALELLKQTRTKLENENVWKGKVFSKFLAQFSQDFDSDDSKFDDTAMIGIYGNAVSGVVEVLRKYDTKNNNSEMYVRYGKWAKGWMERIGSKASIDNMDVSVLYKIQWETDIVHDNYAFGEKDFFRFVTISMGGELTFMITIQNYGMFPIATFKKGVITDIEQMDPVPWKSDKCE